MNTLSYTWIFTLSGIVHTVFTAAMLAVVWIGWRRQRQIGFLVLAAWALVALFNMIGPWLWFSFAQSLLAKIFPGVQTHLLAVLPNIAAGLLSSLLLLSGLALRCFVHSRPCRADNPLYIRRRVRRLAEWIWT
jgi:hypothetical protein